MLENVATRNARNTTRGIDASMFPGPAFNMWGPALACSAEWNAKLQEDFAALSGEWQEFVSRRLADDLNLLQQVGSSHSPEQAWTAYIKFWQKAAEDYAREFATMSKFAGEAVTGGIAAVQHHVATASEKQPPAKAA